MAKTGREDIAVKYDLMPFYVTTQSINRTFVDKVFAICDYYMVGKVETHSRHLYDIYKIYNSPLFKSDEDLKKLIEEVRTERRQLSICPSAKKGIDINSILKKVISSNAYENDYHRITGNIIFYLVSYEVVIGTLNEIIITDLFGS